MKKNILTIIIMPLAVGNSTIDTFTFFITPNTTIPNGFRRMVNIYVN